MMYRHAPIAIVAALLVLGGCSRSPAVQYHVIPTLEQHGRATSPVASAPGIRLGPIQLARHLDRPEIANRVDETRIEYDEANRWAGGLEAEIGRALAEDLAGHLPSDRIVVYPSESTFPIDLEVPIDIQRFEKEDSTGDVFLQVRWSVVRPGGAAEVVELERLRSSAGAGSIRETVDAYGVVIGKLSSAIAVGIRQALSRATNR